MSSLAKIYQDGTYATKNSAFGDDNAAAKISWALKACKEFKLGHQTIAEVGCGGGAILLGVAEALKPESAVGFEPMAEAFEVAEKRTTPTVSFKNETVSHSSNDFFDLVICFDVFEHIEDYFTFLRNLRMLGKNFLFHIPLDMNAQMVARGTPIQMVREEVGHIHYFSKDSAIAALKECGFSVRGHFYTCGADGAYSGRLFRMMKYPRKIAFALAPDLAVRVLGGYSLMVWASQEPV
ncbi:class I SAM-dependent methyltransferase [Luteolibacter sp. SL250]|uniref:class I SAM-dependent methyltransferase n=1 Tax=Luteolibacter sp. SL250 TaxID=2995170 RepID=UPI00226F6835|nr:class I SAM-dependent methyltransferase [Luteolibacter sp. SL250]WAC20450.1 class I SAM-dependent methyltransferase [Luteolibacter sp. SL250]